jgi:hypothetical protein
VFVDPFMTIACAILFVVVGKEAYEDYYEQRRLKAGISLGVMGVIVVIWLLFGLGLLYKLAL